MLRFRPASRALALAIGLLAGAASFSLNGASAQDLGRLLDDGRAARASGDHTLALRRFEAARTLAPGNAEVLYFVGTTLGFLERFPEARLVLESARAKDPANLDVRLALARVMSWQEDFAAAQAEAGVVLRAEPDNLDALLLSAQIAFFDGRREDAEDGYRAVLARDPGNVDALARLGDISMERGDTDAAARHYRRAAELAPDRADIAQRLRGTQVQRWRLDTTTTYSRFSRSQNSAWREVSNRVTYQATPRTSVNVRMDLSERFDQTDTFMEAGLTRRIGERASVYAAFGATPDADFLARQTYSAGGEAALPPIPGLPGATQLTADLKHANYGTGSVRTVNPGLRQYFGERLWLTGRWINVFGSGTRAAGWLGRADWQATSSARLYAGLADAPETVSGRTISTRSYFTGVELDLGGRIAGRLGYTRDDRSNSYIRNAVTAGLTLRF